MHTTTDHPSIPRTRHAIAGRITREAIVRFEDARRLWAEHRDSIGDDLAIDRFLAIDDTRLREAKKQLVRAILAWDERREYGDIRDAERRIARPRGIIHGGRFYAAIPTPDHEWDREGDEPGRDEGDAMGLAVVELANVVDLDAPAPDDRDSYAENAVVRPAPEVPPSAPEAIRPESSVSHTVRSPADREAALIALVGPRPVAEGEGRREPLLPLLRSSHTICLPSLPEPVLLELVVLADGETADVGDLPELADGSWKRRTVGPLEVFTRAVAL